MKSLRFLQDILLFPQRPQYIIFFVTARCNMQCKHCFYWGDVNTKKDELTLEEIEKISRSLPHLFFLRMTGGEPFLRDDLYQIVELFYQNSAIRRIGISTNGLLTGQILETTERVIGAFKDLHFEVGISIDHLHEKHDKIRSYPGGFKKAMHTYDELLRIRERNSNLRVGFLTTMYRSNQHDLDRIYRYLISKCPDSIGMTLIRGNPRDDSMLDIDIEIYNAVRHLLNEYNLKNAIKASWVQRLRVAKTLLSQEIIVDIVRRKKEKIKCLAGRHIAVLYPDGDVSACELIKSHLGNIRDHECSFNKLWKESRRKKIVQHIWQRQCFCTHECFITASLIFSLTGIYRIIKKYFLEKFFSHS